MFKFTLFGQRNNVVRVKFSQIQQVNFSWSRDIWNCIGLRFHVTATLWLLEPWWCDPFGLVSRLPPPQYRSHRRWEHELLARDACHVRSSNTFQRRKWYDKNQFFTHIKAYIITRSGRRVLVLGVIQQRRDYVSARWMGFREKRRKNDIDKDRSWKGDDKNQNPTPQVVATFATGKSVADCRI